MKLEISHLIAILSIVAALGGFYYTTQYRLDDLESSVQQLDRKIDALNTRVNKLHKRNRSKKVNK